MGVEETERDRHFEVGDMVTRNRTRIYQIFMIINLNKPDLEIQNTSFPQGQNLKRTAGKHVTFTAANTFSGNVMLRLAQLCTAERTYCTRAIKTRARKIINSLSV